MTIVILAEIDNVDIFYLSWGRAGSPLTLIIKMTVIHGTIRVHVVVFFIQDTVGGRKPVEQGIQGRKTRFSVSSFNNRRVARGGQPP